MSTTRLVQKTIAAADFKALLADRAGGLLGIAAHIARRQDDSIRLTRPLLGQLLSQATQLEELLDAYGARHNRRWRHFRAYMAIIKRFSAAAYELLHIQHVLPAYRLPAVEGDFVRATDEAMSFTGDVIARTLAQTLDEAGRLGVAVPSDVPAPAAYDEALPQGKLPNDLAKRKVASVSETVTHLATEFLALAAEGDLLHVVARTNEERCLACVPNPVNEGDLRHLRHQFHNMQSMYDTFVLETETEDLDEDLPVLRGHISIVFHLLRTATGFVHYYERHMHTCPAGSRRGHGPLVDAPRLLTTLMRYSITFASRYLAAGQDLCQAMLKRYAEITREHLPVPRYRGFHVRPATLVAKIVLHYGSDVRMVLDGQGYDAGSPMELFRANERINAKKRRWLAMEIARLPLVAEASPGADVQASADEILHALAEQGRLVIYEQPLQLPDEPASCSGTVLQRVVEKIARLQAMGKIDIHADLTIEFVGDKRVLADIRLLAEHGYGEDNSGNNIPLPKKLAYLRRTI